MVCVRAACANNLLSNSLLTSFEVYLRIVRLVLIVFMSVFVLWRKGNDFSGIARCLVV